MKNFRFSIVDLRLAIGLVCLIAGVAHAQQYNATIVVTNNPSHGHTLTVISGTTTNTRTWVTNVTAAATQIAISNSVAASATNLWLQTAANPWTATTYSYQTTNGIVLFQHGTAISASLLTNWGTVTLTTNTTSTAYTLRLPITAEPNAQHRTNQANRVVALLNSYATDDLSASVLGLSAYITNNQPNAITSAMIVDGAVTNADLAADAVTSAKILDGTVSNADLAADAVTSAKILDGTVTNADLAADAVTSAKILDGTVTNADLAADAVTSAKILDGTVTNADLAADAVTSAKIADGSVTNADLAANAVTSNKIDWSTITVPMGSLPSYILTNNQTGVTLDGTFSGDGSGLTGLQSDSTNAVFTVLGPGATGTNTATSTLVIAGDAVASVVSNGATATIAIGPNQAARVRKTSNQSITDATWTPVTFDTEDFDTASFHDNATENTRLTVAVAGRYLVIGNVALSGNAVSGAKLIVNGTNQIAVQMQGNSGQPEGATASALWTFGASDYVELHAYEATGATVTTNSHFSIIRMP